MHKKSASSENEVVQERQYHMLLSLRSSEKDYRKHGQKKK